MHARCRDLETFLRTRVTDLEEEIRSLRDHSQKQDERHADQVKELVDRIMALTAPAATRAMHASQPPPPRIERDTSGAAPRPPAVARLLGAPDPSRRRPIVAPFLTPAAAGFSPAERRPAASPHESAAALIGEVRATAAVDVDPTVGSASLEE